MVGEEEKTRRRKESGKRETGQRGVATRVRASECTTTSSIHSHLRLYVDVCTPLVVVPSNLPQRSLMFTRGSLPTPSYFDNPMKYYYSRKWPATTEQYSTDFVAPHHCYGIPPNSCCCTSTAVLVRVTSKR